MTAQELISRYHVTLEVQDNRLTGDLVIGDADQAIRDNNYNIMMSHYKDLKALLLHRLYLTQDDSMEGLECTSL
jgi:hypothetical protein